MMINSDMQLATVHWKPSTDQVKLTIVRNTESELSLKVEHLS